MGLKLHGITNISSINVSVHVYCLCRGDSLTYLPVDKMAAVLADDISKCILLNEKDRILIQISLKFVPRSSIDNKPALV